MRNSVCVCACMCVRTCLYAYSYMCGGGGGVGCFISFHFHQNVCFILMMHHLICKSLVSIGHVVGCPAVTGTMPLMQLATLASWSLQSACSAIKARTHLSREQPHTQALIHLACLHCGVADLVCVRGSQNDNPAGAVVIDSSSVDKTSRTNYVIILFA